MPSVRLRDLIEQHVKTLTATADTRHTRLLVTALEECLRHAVGLLSKGRPASGLIAELQEAWSGLARRARTA